MFRQRRGSKWTCYKHSDYWRWLTPHFFSRCRDVVTSSFHVHIHGQDSEIQFHWQCELREQQLWLLRIFGFWKQFATIPISNRIVLHAFRHRQESLHFYGYIPIFGYPRKKQAFLSAPRQQISNYFLFYDSQATIVFQLPHDKPFQRRQPTRKSSRDL